MSSENTLADAKLVINYSTQSPTGGLTMMTEVPRIISLHDLNSLLDKLVAAVSRQKVISEIQELEQRIESNKETLETMREFDLPAVIRDSDVRGDESSRVQLEGVKGRIHQVEANTKRAIERLHALKDRANGFNRESNS